MSLTVHEPPPLSSPIATVTHIAKNHVRIAAEDGYEITFFRITGQDIEVIVVSRDGDEAARCRVAAPKASEDLTIDKAQDGSSVDFRYFKVRGDRAQV